MKNSFFLFTILLSSFISYSQVETPNDFFEFINFTKPIRKKILRNKSWKGNQDNFRLYSKIIDGEKYQLLIDFTDKNNLNGDTEDITILNLPSRKKLDEFVSFLVRNKFTLKNKNNSLEEYKYSNNTNLRLTKEIDIEKGLYLLKFTLKIDNFLLYLEKTAKEQQELKINELKERRGNQEFKPSEMFNRNSNSKLNPAPLKRNSPNKLLQTERVEKKIRYKQDWKIKSNSTNSNDIGYFKIIGFGDYTDKNHKDFGDCEVELKINNIVYKSSKCNDETGLATFFDEKGNQLNIKFSMPEFSGVYIDVLGNELVPSVDYNGNKIKTRFDYGSYYTD